MVELLLFPIVSSSSTSKTPADNALFLIRWKFGGECSERDRLEAEQELQETLKDVVDFIHWVNPPALQSLPEIDHVHILVLRGTK
jgi:hypothetical protein